MFRRVMKRLMMIATDFERMVRRRLETNEVDGENSLLSTNSKIGCQIRELIIYAMYQLFIKVPHSGPLFYS
jgi:hypothetical protein